MEQDTNQNAPSKPFDISIHPQQGLIVLAGDLGTSDLVYHTIGHALAQAARAGTHWTIDAAQARVSPAGEAIWIHQVHTYLMGCTLTYNASQLSGLVQSNPDYQHPASTFVAEG
jgi:hypothetical protein